MTLQDRSQPGVSLRLDQVLRVYAYDLDPRTLADLRMAIESGRHRWFHDEFARAIADGSFSDDDWRTAVGTTDESRATGSLPDQQRIVWQVVFPAEPFPAPPG